LSLLRVFGMLNTALYECLYGLHVVYIVNIGRIYCFTWYLCSNVRVWVYAIEWFSSWLVCFHEIRKLLNIKCCLKQTLYVYRFFFNIVMLNKINIIICSIVKICGRFCDNQIFVIVVLISILTFEILFYIFDSNTQIHLFEKVFKI